ncbi:MAG: D-alanyl-lipoteichoic acid biosynthesis protein DltD [Anaerolineae bacterium]
MGYPAFNLSVADGTMRDSLALMRFTLDQRGSLRFIIINVDDLTFLDYNKAQNVQVNRSAFNDVGLYRSLDGDRWYAPLLNLWDQFVRLFTLQQVDASLRLLQVESEGRNQPVFVFDPDGQAQFYRSMSLDESTTQLLTHYRQVGYAGWFQPAHLDDNAFGYLQQLLQQCQRQGISVLGYLPPGHPRYQQYLETEGTGYLSYHNRVVSRLHDLEQIYPFHFMDFTYQSEKLYGDDLEPYFSDAIHPNEAGSVIIMQALYDAFPEGN